MIRERLGRSLQARGRSLSRELSKRLEKRRTSKAYCSLVSHIMHLLDVKVLIDVGANTGQTVDQIRRLGFDGSIVSFEPTPEVFQELRKRCSKDMAWSGHELALGSSPSRREISQFDDASLNSFLSPSPFGAGRFGALSKPPAERTEVEVVRLDSVWDELIPPGSALLKVDTQGLDLDVINGTGDRLDTVVAIQTEAAINTIYEDMPNFQDTYTVLRDLGFELAGLFPVSRDRQRLRLIEADCVFIRSSAARDASQLPLASTSVSHASVRAKVRRATAGDPG